jgi:hypothetical protein
MCRERAESRHERCECRLRAEKILRRDAEITRCADEYAAEKDYDEERSALRYGATTRVPIL